MAYAERAGWRYFPSYEGETHVHDYYIYIYGDIPNGTQLIFKGRHFQTFRPLEGGGGVYYHVGRAIGSEDGPMKDTYGTSVQVIFPNGQQSKLILEADF